MSPHIITLQGVQMGYKVKSEIKCQSNQSQEIVLKRPNSKYQSEVSSFVFMINVIMSNSGHWYRIGIIRSLSFSWNSFDHL